MTWPDETTRIRTISGKTEEECEQKLAALIAEMKAERARLIKVLLTVTLSSFIILQR